MDSAWCSKYSTGVGEYIQIDFDEIVTFNCTVIKQLYPTDRIKGYKIQYFNGTLWENAYIYKGDLIGTSPKFDVFNTITTSKIRLYFTDIQPDLIDQETNPAIQCFEVYYRPDLSNK